MKLIFSLIMSRKLPISYEYSLEGLLLNKKWPPLYEKRFIMTPLVLSKSFYTFSIVICAFTLHKLKVLAEVNPFDVMY